ncbi:MAG: hypothetical protein ACI82S_001756 [Patiriisocius sp.]|jgi:hypothetical protein
MNSKLCLPLNAAELPISNHMLGHRKNTRNILQVYNTQSGFNIQLNIGNVNLNTVINVLLTSVKMCKFTPHRVERKNGAIFYVSSTFSSFPTRLTTELINTCIIEEWRLSFCINYCCAQGYEKRSLKYSGVTVNLI